MFDEASSVGSNPEEREVLASKSSTRVRNKPERTGMVDTEAALDVEEVRGSTLATQTK